MLEILFVSLIHLIQHPETYHHKQVRVVGVASLKFEGKALYVSKEDFDHAITKNAVWLDVELNDNVKKNHGKYVMVEGVFDESKKGHLKLYSGSITDIKRIEVWEGRDKSKE